MKNIACICEIRPAGHFNGSGDFDSFLKVLKGTSSLILIPVAKPYSNVGLVENWYKCSVCSSIWRLVEPDPPFYGIWEKVEDEL